MKSTRLVVMVAVALALLAMGSAGFAADSAKLSSGDRVVFLGDSITQQMIYTRQFMDYVSMRYPDLKVSYRNAGWGGDTAPGALKRLDRDVLSLKPNVVTICFGMNDAGYGDLKEDLYNKFLDGMKGLIAALKKNGVRVVLLTPGCVDPDANKKLSVYNDTLARYAKGVMELATAEKIKAANIHVLMLDAQTMAKNEDPKFTGIPDGVHPSEPFHAIMTFGLIKAMGMERKPSGLAIDAEAREARTDRCTVTGLKVTDKSVSFTRTDESLPSYVSPEIEGIINFAPYLGGGNDYPFRVSGLKSGKWKLVVQGKDMGTYDSMDIGVGLELSKSAGPWQALWKEVDKLAAEQEQLYYVRWRQLQLGNWPAGIKPEIDAAAAKLDKMIQVMEADRAKALANRGWTWSLTKVE